MYGRRFVLNIGGRRMGAGGDRNVVPGVLRRKSLEILYPKQCILGDICTILGPQNGPVLLC